MVFRRLRFARVNAPICDGSRGATRRRGRASWARGGRDGHGVDRPKSL